MFDLKLKCPEILALLKGRRSIEIGNFQTLIKLRSLVIRTRNFRTL